MLLAYSGPLAAYLLAGGGAGAGGARVSLLRTLWVCHYAKRLAEVLFVHKYSGAMPVATAISMCANYSFLGYASAKMIALDGDADAEAGAQERATGAAGRVGVALWVVGQLGNFYHHWLLARARSGGGGKAASGYTPLGKLGGLFGPLTCPHYLFEVVAWLGYALVGRTAVHAEMVAFFALYLWGRARKTRAWYASKKLL